MSVNCLLKPITYLHGPAWVHKPAVFCCSSSEREVCYKHCIAEKWTTGLAGTGRCVNMDWERYGSGQSMLSAWNTRFASKFYCNWQQAVTIMTFKSLTFIGANKLYFLLCYCLYICANPFYFKVILLSNTLTNRQFCKFCIFYDSQLN